jgi:hypothetical protein
MKQKKCHIISATPESSANQYELHRHLQKCFEMLGEHKDKKMYSVMSHKGTAKREGTIRIAIERPIGMHGWYNYGKVVQVYEIVTLRNTSLYRMGCIISSLNSINDVKRHQHEQEHTRSMSSVGSVDSDYVDMHKANQQSFADAIAFAIEGMYEFN